MRLISDTIDLPLPIKRSKKEKKKKRNADIQLRLISRQYLSFDNPLIHLEDENEAKVNYAYAYEDKGLDRRRVRREYREV